MLKTHNAGPGLFILGMHRSGTSCLAGMLECAGFNAGQVDEWNPDNPKGNREHLAVTPLNEGLLRQNGGSWDAPPSRVSVDDRQKRDMETIVSGLEAAAQPWQIKDPRILLLPRPWLDLRANVRCIGIFRHPLAVAQSLNRRNGLDLQQGIQLWIQYNKCLLGLLREQSFPLVLFTADSQRLLSTVNAALTSLFEESITAGDIHPQRAAEFFSQDLIHHTPELAMDIDDSLAEAGVSRETREQASDVWKGLLALQNPGSLKLEPATGGKKAAGKPSPEQFDDVERLDEAIAQSSDPIPLFRSHISQLQKSGKQDELLLWLRQWLQRKPEDPYLNWELAKHEWSSGEKEAALAHALTASRLAPGWVVPLSYAADWAREIGEWQTAADSYQSLLAAHRSTTWNLNPSAQLFFDQGEGYSARASIQLPLAECAGFFDLQTKAGDLGINVSRVRLDPSNQPVIVDQLELKVTDDKGQESTVTSTGSNALFHDGDTFHFDTEDPQVFFDFEAGTARNIEALSIKYRILHAGDDAVEASYQRLCALANDLADSRRTKMELAQTKSELERTTKELEQTTTTLTQRSAELQQRSAELGQRSTELEHALGELRHTEQELDRIEIHRQAFARTSEEIRQSISARIGTGITRILMSPLKLGSGKTSLDVLAEQWLKLDSAIRRLTNRK